LEYIYIDNTQLYDKDDNRLAKNTRIDMTIVGLHIENQLLQRLQEDYLSQVCIKKGGYWYCGCSPGSVDGFPDIGLGLFEHEEYYKFTNSEYFIFPYYTNETGPSLCRLAIE